MLLGNILKEIIENSDSSEMRDVFQGQEKDERTAVVF
jgi:hypothetical protein